MGINVKALFGVYGRERDKLIARSKIVLNMHHYSSQIFEIVRVFYLLTNRKAVVAECNARDAIPGVSTQRRRCRALRGTRCSLQAPCGGRQATHELEEKGFATISRLPQAELIALLLQP